MSEGRPDQSFMPARPENVPRALASACPENGPGAIEVMLVDADEADYLFTRHLLSEIPGGAYRLDWTMSYEAGLMAIDQGQHEVYLLDYHLGERTGLELLREAHAHNRSAVMIL